MRRGIGISLRGRPGGQGNVVLLRMLRGGRDAGVLALRHYVQIQDSIKTWKSIDRYISPIPDDPDAQTPEPEWI